MEIMYYISAQSYGIEVNKALKKAYWYFGLLAQLLSLIIWSVDYLLSRDKYASDEMVFINILTILTVLFFAVIIHFIFNVWLPKLHNKFIIKKNQRNIGSITLELDEDYIHITSDNKTVKYKRDNVLGVKTLELTHCIIFSKNMYIVVPKKSEQSGVDEQQYTDDVNIVIKEIKRTSRQGASRESKK